MAAAAEQDLAIQGIIRAVTVVQVVVVAVQMVGRPETLVGQEVRDIMVGAVLSIILQMLVVVVAVRGLLARMPLILRLAEPVVREYLHTLIYLLPPMLVLI